MNHGDGQQDHGADENGNREAETEQGPMARKLEEATEDALLTGGRAGQRAIEDAGFSEELKERLLSKVKDAQFRSEQAPAFAQAGLPSLAGPGTRSIASSPAWSGEEATEDAVLRMLDDAHKPLKPELRGKARLPELQPIDTRIRGETKVSAGSRVASARDKVAVYSGMGLKDGDNGLSKHEKETLRQEFRNRFKPAARALPNSVTGLASLANERIEDAIARGQFKNIPRGKEIRRDQRSDNPFIDTTEYLMNKMVKRQDMVPPWIEKQQEVARTAHTFRSRLRNDWKRHAARTIASRGGSLEEQMDRARRLAQAEELHNPLKRNVDEIPVSTNSTEDPVMVKVRQRSPAASEAEPSVASEEADRPRRAGSLPPPFRDPEWVATERSYMELAIKNLNSLTRSYNLMAPELAKKPYFSLERELNTCYANVAPHLAGAIRDRATRPSRPVVATGGRTTAEGFFQRIGGGGGGRHEAAIYESKAPHYGFKELWRDLWHRSPSSR